MADKNRFYLYTEYKSFTDDMTDEEAGKLFKVILDHENGLDVENVPPEIKPVWSFIRKRLDNGRAAYDAACEAHREAGANGGRPKTKNNQTEPKKPNSKNSGTDIDTDTDTDTDIDTDKDFDNDSEEIFSSTSNPVKSEDLQKIADRWNELPENVARLKSINRSGERWRLLRARIKENGVDGVLDAIDKVRQSSFLVGKNDRGWTVTFDWFIKPGNFSKVSEGNYKDRIPTARSGTTNVFDEWDRA